MEAEKIEIPDELKILNPELQKKPVVIGVEAYMVYPLTEGQAERVSQLISDIISDISTMDMKCPSCNHVFSNALGRQETCNKCKGGNGSKKGKGGGHRLVSMQRTPVESLTHEDRIPRLIEELVGIPKEGVKETLTINQFKHIAGVLYEQNFNEEGSGLPEESRKNFEALLGWIGLKAPKTQEAIPVKDSNIVDLAKSMKPLPTSTDSQENISKDDGKEIQKVKEKDS